MRTSTVLSLAASVSSAVAQYKGFNYGSTNGSYNYVEADFEDQFNTAANLVGTSGFTAARLYTMIQGGTTDTVISAIPAALNTNTKLLLGLWASAGQADFTNEVTALKNAISQYSSQGLGDAVVGISVGSEDLYRISPPALQQSGVHNPGAEPADLVNYISQVRSAIAGTALSGVSIGHVDTWTAWVNGSNDAVINAVDWLGVDAYPYFQNTQSNAIDSGASLFEQALGNTTNAANGKDVWVTETGWPVSGSTENLAVPSTQNAEQYWQQVGCDLLFGKYNTFWYTLDDFGSTPSFGVIDSYTGGETPLYDLSCSASSSSSSSSTSTQSATSIASAATVPTTVPASATSSVVISPVPSPSLGTQSSSVAAGTSAAGSVAGSSASSSVTGSSAAGSVAGSSAAGSSAAASSVAASSAAQTTAAAYGSSPAAGQSTTVSAVTTGSTTSVVAGGQTLTIYQTTLITITSCSSVCQTTMATATGSAPASASAVESSAAAAVSSHASAVAASVSVSGSATSSAAAANSTGCSADLNGDYQYPHLIVPVSSASPNTAYGTQYNGTVNSTVSTIFNFDIPASYAGKTCSLVFLFPEQSQLETSAYTFNNQGGLVSHVLSSTADQSTTYANQPSQALQNGAISSLQSGNSYVISTDSCPAGTAVSFELSSTNGLALEFFEDYNPSPLGLYVRAC